MCIFLSSEKNISKDDLFILDKLTLKKSIAKEKIGIAIVRKLCKTK